LDFTSSRLKKNNRVELFLLAAFEDLEPGNPTYRDILSPPGNSRQSFFHRRGGPLATEQVLSHGGDVWSRGNYLGEIPFYVAGTLASPMQGPSKKHKSNFMASSPRVGYTHISPRLDFTASRLKKHNRVKLFLVAAFEDLEPGARSSQSRMFFKKASTVKKMSTENSGGHLRRKHGRLQEISPGVWIGRGRIHQTKKPGLCKKSAFLLAKSANTTSWGRHQGLGEHTFRRELSATDSPRARRPEEDAKKTM
jgi:hypothetical protein